jgi:cytochrome c-type biogenesis protein CcmE
MTRKRRRLVALGVGLALLASGTALVLNALRDTLVFFYSPSELAAAEPPNRPFRIGGLVEEGSLSAEAGQATVRFRVTDLTAALAVEFTGIPPDLFAEGQGVVVQGTLRADGVFVASEVLAKHDETYMPPEVAAALKKSGRWRDADE